MTTNITIKGTANTQYDFETWLQVEYGYSYEEYNHMSKYERSSLRQEYSAQNAMD